MNPPLFLCLCLNHRSLNLALSVNSFLGHSSSSQIPRDCNCLTKCFHFDLVSGHNISATTSLLEIAKHYNSVRLIFVSFFVPALLECKIYSVVRRHRYEIPAQQAEGNEQNALTRETKPKSFNSQRIPHIPFAFNLLFATIVHWLFFL